ncbi:MAG: class I SAM-dependent methyltransferase family protein [Candidatus Bathyarchaeota archaeon]|nr:MAG: class I SAM-dependent methyltransferase family protein [Candidatus Bathyarchaeota archaeon]
MLVARVYQLGCDRKMERGFKAVLARRLEASVLKLINRSFDVVGDIAIIKIPKAVEQHERLVAEAIMQTNTHIKTVLRQTSAVASDYRLRAIKWIGGEKKTETIHRENGCIFGVDLKECYFSPRLIHERMRIAGQVRPGEVIVNMFAGVGCYSIVIARHSRAERVYSVDINPAAVRSMQENINTNKAAGQVVPVEGDAKIIIERSLQNVADRVLMPLPQRAYEYLDSALQALKPSGGWIHYYEFEHALKGESPVEKAKVKVVKRLRNSCLHIDGFFGGIVRSVGPNWYQVALDIHLANLL